MYANTRRCTVHARQPYLLLPGLRLLDDMALLEGGRDSRSSSCRSEAAEPQVLRSRVGLQALSHAVILLLLLILM